MAAKNEVPAIVLLAGFMNRLQPRDVIALILLVFIFVLIACGFDGWLQGVGAVIIGYYFSKRVYEEKNQK